MKSFLLVVLTTLLVSVAAFAQTTTGRLVGTVAGADGAVIPGATVVVTDNKTSRERTTTTNGEGGFSIPLLDIGSYSIKVTSPGFKTSTTTITIEVGQEYSLNVGMEVGEVSENVTVTAGADIINSTNAELTSTISNRQITELPLAARNPLSLILTQAGSSSNPSQNTSINGGRTSSTNITRDGVNINDNFIRSNATDFSPGRPSVDNVEEFSLSSQSSVDSGFGSAQVTLVTPRGGNRFSGAVWEYNRNASVGANTFFNNASGRFNPTDQLVLSGLRKAGDERTPRPPRNRNQYGFKVSGPILKDRLFFFVYAEKLKDKISANKLITVLTPSAKAGLFTYASGGVIRSASLFAPGVFTVGTSGVPVPTGINSFVQSAYLANMPAGNSTEAGDGLNTTGFRFNQKADSTRDSITSRIDYDLNSKNNINGVIDYNFENNFRSDLGGTDPIPLVIQPARNVTWSGGWRYSPTATINNEFRIGRFYSQPDFFRSDAPASQYFLTTLITNPQPLNGGAIFRPQGRAVKTLNVQDTVSWLLGNHSIRLGAQYQKSEINAYNDAGTLPVYQIGLSTAGPTINFTTLGTNGGGPVGAGVFADGRALAALLGGVISSGSRTFNADPTAGFTPGLSRVTPFKFQLFAPYVLDSWKVRPELTLTGGIRWDYQTPLQIENGAQFEPVVAAGRSVVDAVLDPNGTYQLVGGNAGKKNAFYKADKNNFAPSFGFAWAPKNLGGFLNRIIGQDFVIRGGYRKSFVNDELVTAPNNALANNSGFQTNISALFAGQTLLDDRIGGLVTSSITTPAFSTTRTYTQNNAAAFSNLGTVFAVDPNLKVPSQNDYTLGIQRRFGDWVGEARYVGGYSKNMLRTIDYNQITLPAAFRSDFAIVRANVLAGCPAAPNGGALGSALACANGTTLITTLAGNGSIIPGNILGTNVQQGAIAELAWNLLLNNIIPNTNVSPLPGGTTRALFLPNPNTGVANVLENGGSYFYHSGQFELRRQFKNGLYMQANYTFAKDLTDAVGTGQTRVEPFLNNADRALDYARADYDQTHVFNVNSIYELPFGKNRRFLNKSTILDYIIGGWQLGLIWRLGSGAPITFTDARGTLNRAGRSGRQTAMTSLTPDQLKKVVGTFKTPCGIYFVDPAFININQTNLAAGNCSALNTGLATGTLGGRASSGFGQPTFGGQIFFNNGPLQTGGLRRAVVNGPSLSSADISMLKNFRITERITFQLRGEAYNVTNSAFFAPGQFIDINSTTFGRQSGTSVGARVMQFAGRISF